MNIPIIYNKECISMPYGLKRWNMTTTSEAIHMAEATPRDPLENLTTIIKQAVAAYLAQEQIAFDIEQLPIDLRFSAQASFGDYSMPIMPWGGKQKLARKPLSLAEALATIW